MLKYTNIGLGFQIEKMTKNIKMGLHVRKNITEVEKDRNVHDGIGVKMMKLNPLIEKRPRKKIEVGIKSPRSIEGKNITISLVPS